ncbi:MAG: helicase C-terminal domain-containing protein [Candidatus Altiarchaeia archaeon]
MAQDNNPDSASEYKFFPHGLFRPHQKDGLESIRVSAVKGIPLLFNSPTGTGKTAMVLGGILEARAKGEKLCVITRTHSQYKMFVEEFSRIKKKNKDLTFGVLVGRNNVCPMSLGHEACGLLRKNTLMEIKKGQNMWHSAAACGAGAHKTKEAICPYYANCYQRDETRPLFNRESMQLIEKQMNDPLTPGEFAKRCCADRHPKCPYELLKNTLNRADVLVIHYQYLLEPEIREVVSASNWLGCGFEDVHLAVDEAHNLASYIQEISSSACTKDDVVDALKLMRDKKIGDASYKFKDVGETGLTDALFLLTDFNLFLDHYFSAKRPGDLLAGEVEDVISEKGMFKPAAETLKILEQVAVQVRTQFEAKKKTQEIPEETPLPGICRVADTLSKSAQEVGDRFIRTINIKPNTNSIAQRIDSSLNITDYEISLRVIDVDPRDSVKYLADNFRSLTLISGTLSPTGLYRKLFFYPGTEVNEKNIPYPFPKENRMLLAAKDVSSQRRLREDIKNIRSVEECIKALFSIDGNIALFFTGYDMKKQYAPYCARLCREMDRELMDESKETNKQRMIEEYKTHGNAVLLGVCKGSFSEGVDYIGEAMNAVAVIGLPLAPWTIKQQMINRYYETAFGRGVGKIIAYDLPAVTAAVQAAGRCIRSTEDTGVIILADSRYCESSIMGVKKILPDWMQEEMIVLSAGELKPLVENKNEEWRGKVKKVSDDEESLDEEPERISEERDESELDIEDRELYNALRKWRMEKARAKKVVAYHIINNRTLRSLIYLKPARAEDLSGVKGLGPQKTEEYGTELLEIIRQYSNNGGSTEVADEITNAILETIKESGEKYGAGKIGEILSGSKNRYIETMGLNNLKNYGRLSQVSIDSITDRIEELVRQNVLYKTFSLYPALKIKDAEQKRL